jgi:nascent polypeptide-associated complex subunit alpha
MFPGLGKINPAQMQRLMKQFGIKSEEVKAKKVTIELEDKKLVIENPSVIAIDARGQKTFQVIGETKEETLGPSDEDIEMVMEQAKASREEAVKALKESNGDIAEAILKLKK